MDKIIERHVYETHDNLQHLCKVYYGYEGVEINRHLPENMTSHTCKGQTVYLQILSIHGSLRDNGLSLLHYHCPMCDPSPFNLLEKKVITAQTEINTNIWHAKGECPKCKDGTKPECVQGAFICSKCNWQNA